MSNQAVLHEGKKCDLLPFTFLDKIGGAIIKHFGKEHDITLQMFSDRKQYGKRGIFYVTNKKTYQKEPAFALTTEEIDFLRKNYEKSQEIF